ncbi:HAD hydrolase-like protein [Thermoactinomyces sp. CICC 10521]|nr:HAD hydrolase-like protein [Thermoactinomyces sp. CICC 10521]
MQVKAIIFDLDGTLFQSEKVGLPAFLETFRVLKEEGLYREEMPTEDKIKSVFGMTHDELWQTLLPDATKEIREKADRMMLGFELELIGRHRGEFYPGVKETLHALKERGYALFIASNGVGPYVRGVLESGDLTSLFTGIYSAGEYKTKSKVDLVSLLKEQHQVTDGMMVGDRSSDVEAGKQNGLVTVGCRYSGFPQFGSRDELAGADHLISSFAQMLDLA